MAGSEEHTGEQSDLPVWVIYRPEAARRDQMEQGLPYGLRADYDAVDQ